MKINGFQKIGIIQAVLKTLNVTLQNKKQLPKFRVIKVFFTAIYIRSISDGEKAQYCFYKP